VSITFVGTGFREEPYGFEEKLIWEKIIKQIDIKFPADENLVISMTWFGSQFNNLNDNWEKVMGFKNSKKFHNIFLVATVDPIMIQDNSIRDIIHATSALHCYKLGNFDTSYQFNFFAIALGKYFTTYRVEDIMLKDIKNIYVNYNRKPKIHRINLVEQLYKNKLLDCGVVTLGKDENNVHNKGLKSMYLSIGEKNEDYIDNGNDKSIWNFGIPQDYFSLHNMNVWNSTFLYINGATEFEARDDLFCQQDVFKPLIGLRPYVINGVQKTYHWLRYHGFKTFNHYWKHIDIENGDVHKTIIELIKFLKRMETTELQAMYNDMIPDLRYNKERFFEFADEQSYKMEHIFE